MRFEFTFTWSGGLQPWPLARDPQRRADGGAVHGGFRECCCSVYFCEQVIAISDMDLVFSLKAFRCDLSAGVGVGGCWGGE